MPDIKLSPIAVNLSLSAEQKQSLDALASRRVSQGKEPLTQDELVGRLLSGLSKRPHWFNILTR